MDKIDAYLSIVPLWVLVLLPVALAFFALVTPKRLLLPIALIVLPGWHDLGRMSELGTIAAVGKVTSFGAFAFVLVSALLYPAPKRRLAKTVWYYPLYGLVGIPFLLGVVDRNIAEFMQLQWAVLSLAAIAVVRCMSSQREFLRLLTCFGIGCAFSLMLPLSSMVFNPHSVRWRFFPWGANPNQIGVLFIMATPISLYMALQFRGLMWRAFFLMASVAGAFMAVISASRSTIFLTFPLCGIVLLPVVKRPSIIIIIGLIVILGAGWATTVTQKTSLARVQSLKTGRGDTLAFYLKDEILPRAATGLLGTSGKLARDSDTTGSHAHNAYAEQMYMFGMVVGGLPILMAAYTMWCVWNVFKFRRYVFPTNTLALLLSTYMLFIYAHGFENSSIYYATYSWAFFHVLLSCFFMSLWDSLRTGGDGYGSAFHSEHDHDGYAYAYDADYSQYASSY